MSVIAVLPLLLCVLPLASTLITIVTATLRHLAHHQDTQEIRS